MNEVMLWLLMLCQHLGPHRHIEVREDDRGCVVADVSNSWRVTAPVLRLWTPEMAVQHARRSAGHIAKLGGLSAAAEEAPVSV